MSPSAPRYGMDCVDIGGVNGYIGAPQHTSRAVHSSADTNPPAGPEQGAYSLSESCELCERMAKSHYENFPVASRLVPRDKRPYVWSVYAFARVADDFADEGAVPVERRLEQLDRWERYLNECCEGRASHPVFIALAETVRRFSIPRQPLADLLAAFRLDVTRKRFETFSDLLYYCKHSANPVGQLVLAIFGDATSRTIALSDHICTALQLTNFWQDCAIDWGKGRLYIPLEDMARFGYTEKDLDDRIADERFRQLMAFEVERTRDLFEEGKPLLAEAVPELRFELTLVWRGGMRILEKIEAHNYDVLHTRPVLSWADKVSLFTLSHLT